MRLCCLQFMLWLTAFLVHTAAFMLWLTAFLVHTAAFMLWLTAFLVHTAAFMLWLTALLVHTAAFMLWLTALLVYTAAFMLWLTALLVDTAAFVAAEETAAAGSWPDPEHWWTLNVGTRHLRSVVTVKRIHTYWEETEKDIHVMFQM